MERITIIIPPQTEDDDPTITDYEICEHPNIIFYDDEYDEHGNRTAKHSWYCPDCDFLQVG